VVLAADIAGLRSALSEVNDPWLDTPTDQYITFDEATGSASLLNVHVSNLMTAVVTKNVRACRTPETRFILSKYLLNETDFAMWLSAIASESDMDTVRAGVAKQILKLNDQTFEHLINEGVFPIARKSSPLDDRRVPLRIVFDLLRRIRLLKRVEEFCGIQKKELQSALMESGANPIAPKHLSGRHLRLALIEDLLKPTIIDLLRRNAQVKWGRSVGSKSER
jgi:hypothetical protein